MSKFGACVDGTLTWIGNNKMVTFLGLVAFSLMVSTWTLAAINVKLDEKIDNLNSEIDELNKHTTHESSSTASTTTIGTTTSTPHEQNTEGGGDTSSTTEKTSNENNLRLSEFIVPTLYDLFIHPDLSEGDENGFFSGWVKIFLDVSQFTKEIVLHSHLLNITSVSFTAQDDPEIGIEYYEMYAEVEQVKVILNKMIEPGTNYSLELEFQGSMLGDIVGLYRSTYKDEDGNDRYIATSKFEPTFARQAFPCFDEPAMKAKFKISLIKPNKSEYSALSNMDEISQEPYGDGLIKVNFRESVPMSTYLTVFIVSDFVSISEEIVPAVGDNFTLRCFSTPAQVKKLDFALKTATDVIKFYIEYFNIPYPLPKLDLAAIPDFVSGAMETWGLVTYRETNLLYDPAVSSTSNKQRIAGVIGHEFAHMWFGNLVTMKWWSDLWLNEGFASYIEFKGVNSALPEWEMEDQFTVDTMHSILDLDATLGSHPIVVGVETPDQITEIFDSVTYNKGASVIRMIEDFIGIENFREGVTAYLNENAYKNADSNDLVKHLEGKIAEDVPEIVNTWIRQKGLPVVTVQKIPGTNNFRLTQKRFLTDPESESKETVVSEFNYKWSIPITYTTSANPQEVHRQWFHHNQDEVTIQLPEPVEWIKINKDQVGYYRVKYDSDMWKNLNDALERNISTMSVLDRAHLLNDVFSLAQATQVSYDTALTMTKYLLDETHFVPWDVVSSKMKGIRNLLYYTEHYSSFKEYAVSLVNSSFLELTKSWEVKPEEHLKNLFRITILDFACSMDHPQCLAEIGAMFKEWISNPKRETERPTPDLRSLVYSYGMKSVGGETEWNTMFELFAKEQDATEKSKLQAALTTIDQPWILKKLIDLASADEKYVRKQDYFSLMASISSNRVGEPIVWDYVRDNWVAISERFGLNERNLGRMIPSITARFTTQSKLNEMKKFFSDYPDAGAGANARIQALETVENNIKWLEVNQKSIADWLATQQ